MKANELTVISIVDATIGKEGVWAIGGFVVALILGVAAIIAAIMLAK
jgi:hypothetical protein